MLGNYVLRIQRKIKKVQLGIDIWKLLCYPLIGERMLRSLLKSTNVQKGSFLQCSSALSFTCVWYSVIITAGMAYIFLIQLINISYNVTEREVQQALRQKTGRRLLCGLIVDTGQYNRGFLRNWHQFSTLGTHTAHAPAEDIV